MRSTSTLLLLLSLALPVAPARAQDGEQRMSEEEVAAQLEQRFQFLTGEVTVGSDLATIKLPQGYRYLGPQDARFMLEDVWGNPPDPQTLGMVLPPGKPLTSTWGIVVSFEADGYVADEDAASMDWNELLETLQDEAKAGSAARKKAGYPGVQLLGWAESPRYDATSKKLFWAKRLKFDDSPDVTLNYDVRILGRRGFLVLQAVASSTELTDVTEGCQSVLQGTDFKAGQRYSDYKEGTDKKAAYGVGGLILGGAVAAKLVKGGLLKVLLKPLLIVGAIVISVVAKLFTGRKAEPA